MFIIKAKIITNYFSQAEDFFGKKNDGFALYFSVLL